MIEAGLIDFQMGEIISAVCVVTLLVSGSAGFVLLARAIVRKL